MMPQTEKTFLLIDEITESSKEQKSEVEQVNSAIELLNVFTQENASVSKQMSANGKKSRIAGLAPALAGFLF